MLLCDLPCLLYLLAVCMCMLSWLLQLYKALV